MNAALQAALFERGLAYLYHVRAFAIEPDLIEMVHHCQAREAVCIGIGSHIDALNAQLQIYLQACHDCFHVWQRRSVQIFAAPFSPSFCIDGLCNLQVDPITILVDVGRVVPEDWLALVAHEYAHAHLGSPGHHPEFVQVLSHLCLGLDLPSPIDPEIHSADWRSFPPYRSTLNPDRFWLSLSCDPPLPVFQALD